MARFLKRRQKEVGLPPGTPTYIGTAEAEKVRITCLSYNIDEFEADELSSFSEIEHHIISGRKTWIRVQGLSKAMIEDAGAALGIHALFLEDILNTDHRPKVDELEEQTFLVLKTLFVTDDGEFLKFRSEQVSLVLGERFVVTFEESPSDLFKPVERRLVEGQGRIRRSGQDYLFYALMDSVVDSCFLSIERLGSSIESIGASVESNESASLSPARLNSLKTEVLFIRKHLVPIREGVAHLVRNPPKEFNEKTSIYVRDAYENIVQQVDTVDQYREILNNLQQYQLAHANQRLAEVMKVLTMFTAFFVPLTFIVGLYGMNFRYIPELSWKHGYAFVWVLILSCSGLLYLFFRRRGWF